MIFHYHWIVPRLGPCLPPSGIPKWKCFLTVDGGPIEYSWKWNTADGAPVTRYTVEPIGSHIGTILDPFNQATTRELLSVLSLRLPSLDLTWFYHFATANYGSENEVYVTETGAHFNTNLDLAFEFLEKDLVVKAYFSPRKLGEKGIAELAVWTNAIRGALPGSASLDKVVDFLKTDSHGLLLQPFMLAVDCVKPSNSRMKLYFQTTESSFDSVRTIMTLGGQIQGVEIALDELHRLIELVLGLEKNFPSSQDLPAPASAVLDNVLKSGYRYYFDFATGSSMPGIQLYIPLRLFGTNDLNIARGLIDFMESCGRGQYATNYMRVLEELATYRPLDAAAGIQSYISCIFQKDSLSITTYLSPESYSPLRQAK